MSKMVCFFSPVRSTWKRSRCDDMPGMAMASRMGGGAKVYLTSDD